MKFPIDLFPKSFREAVEGLREYTNAPPEFTSMVALSIAGFACQGLWNATAHRFDTTTSIYAIILNESGGLKSEITKYLTRGIRRFEDTNQSRYEGDMANYRAEQSVWESEYASAKKEGDVLLRKQAIYDLEMSKPKAPFSPTRTVEAPTVVGLTRGFQHQGPSLLNLSTDAGVFLSGTTMSDQAQSRQMVSIMAKVWSGESYDRMTGDEQVLLSGKRLSVLWLVQGKMASDFLSNQTFLAQGIMARFLTVKAPRYVAPQATYADGNAHESKARVERAVELFNLRIYELLQRGLELRQGTTDEIEPPIFQWEQSTLRAQQDWVNSYCEPYRNGAGAEDDNLSYYQRLEEHCARIATVFALMDGQAAVTPECANAARKLVEWITSGLQNLDRDGDPESDEDRAYKALRGYIEGRKGQTLRMRDMLRNGRKAFTSAPERVRNAAVRRVIDLGMMEAVMVTNANNVATEGFQVSNDAGDWR